MTIDEALQGTALGRATFDDTVDEAARSPIGVAWKTEGGVVCLAVRDGDDVVAGVSRGDSPARAGWWRLAEGWHAELERNFVRLADWARDAERVRIPRPEPIEAVGADEAALLAAVAAAPDDDAPRLIYADWLTQRGAPRGEVIALQCALELLHGADPERERLHARALRIVHAHPGVAGRLRRQRVTWRRGFIAHAQLSPAFVTDDALFAREPVLDSLAIEDLTGPLTGAASAALLDRVRELTLLSFVDERAFLARARVSRLEVIARSAWKPTEIAALLENPTLAGRRLRIRGTVEATKAMRDALRGRGWTIER
jgi:uncharacterized protein (TIGR02996 family)